MRKQIANILTGCRILGSVVLMFCPALTPCFYAVYLFCGLTDMIDGSVARMTNSASAAGAMLDTVADFVFMAAASVKLLPLLQIPGWLWTWIAVIAGIKAGNIVLGFICRKKLIFLHTCLDKITGMLLFLLPMMLSILDLKYSATAICAIATLAGIQEGYYIASGRNTA